MVVLWQLGGLSLTLIVQGSEDRAVQRRLGKRLLHTLTGLGPCFISWANPSPPD